MEDHERIKKERKGIKDFTGKKQNYQKENFAIGGNNAI